MSGNGLGVGSAGLSPTVVSAGGSVPAPPPMPPVIGVMGVVTVAGSGMVASVEVGVVVIGAAVRAVAVAGATLAPLLALVLEGFAEVLVGVSGVFSAA